MSSTPNPSSQCRHVRLPHVLPGWGCCQCRCYNGYQRVVCRNCGHPPCYELRGPLGREALELRPICHDPHLMQQWLNSKAN